MFTTCVDEHVTCYQQKPLALDFKEKKFKKRMTIKHTQRKKNQKTKQNGVTKR
jgi:hypothetical protein